MSGRFSWSVNPNIKTGAKQTDEQTDIQMDVVRAWPCQTLRSKLTGRSKDIEAAGVPGRFVVVPLGSNSHAQSVCLVLGNGKIPT